MNRSLYNNIRVIYLMGFCSGFTLVIPVFVPLLQAHGLSMAEILQTQAVFALTIALCEVPSGYVADLWGRRRAILAGSCLNGVGYLALIWAEGFADFLLYELLLGIGFSLLSGADLALLYDTETCLQERGLPGGVGAGKSLSRLIAVESAASGAAGIAAGLLLLGSMPLLLAVQAVVGLAPALLALTLLEPPRVVQSAGHRDNVRRIAELLFSSSPVLLWTAFAIVVFGLLALYVFWVYQKYWEFQGIPLTCFGYLWALYALTVSLSARYASALEQRLGTRGLLALVAGLPIIALLGMAFAEGWAGVLFGLGMQLSRGLSMSLFYEALNRRVPGDFRATVNSLVSLGVRALFIASGPLLGYALDALGVRWVLLALAAVFTPLLALVLVPLLIRIRREAMAAVAPAATG